MQKSHYNYKLQKYIDTTFRSDILFIKTERGLLEKIENGPGWLSSQTPRA
jgi:hypothetical protein